VTNKHIRTSQPRGRPSTTDRDFRYHLQPRTFGLATTNISLFTMSPGLFRDIRTGLTVVVAIQLGAILFPPACCSLILILFGKLIRVLHKYFKPDYETALVGEYIRPIIGLRLCWKCTMLRYWPKGYRKRHYDDPGQLKTSASKGCWLCHSVHEQFLQSKADFENPPRHHRPDDLRTHHLLLWFAERTETSSGFLDQLRGKSMYSMSASVFSRR
jgi:hypothetical protein